MKRVIEVVTVVIMIVAAGLLIYWLRARAGPLRISIRKWDASFPDWLRKTGP